jgi:hypothetical protein
MTDLPLSTHELVLGADIDVWHRATETHDYPGHLTRESSVRVHAYGGGRANRGLCRRYLAAWARRTIERPTTEGSTA